MAQKFATANPYSDGEEKDEKPEGWRENGVPEKVDILLAIKESLAPNS